MRIYIFTTALLLSLTTLTTSAEADFNPPPGLTLESLEAFQQGVRTGIFWAPPHEKTHAEDQAYDLMVEARPPITTVEGQRQWLDPLEAINYAAIGTRLSQPLSKPASTFLAPLMDSVDPFGDFRYRMRMGIFVDPLDRDSLQAHQYMTVLNNHHPDAPSYLLSRSIYDQSGLGSFDKAFLKPFIGVFDINQLSIVDPVGRFPGLAKVIPEVNMVTPQKESSSGFFLELVKTLNEITRIGNIYMPDAPIGAE